MSEERLRLNSQCWKILDALRRGPAQNSELAKIALKYTGRISELRERGYDIQCIFLNKVTGLSVYKLNEGKEN